jgi:hypothetical protein
MSRYTEEPWTKERIRAYQKVYYPAHRERYRILGRIQSRKLAGRFNVIRKLSSLRGFELKINLKQYSKLVASGTCRYCGKPLPETGGGLDRKNSDLGYTIKNCVPCCTICNRMRGEDAISYEEMFEVVKLLKRLRRKKNA